MAWTKEQSATRDQDGVLITLQESVGGINEKILNFGDVDVGHRVGIFSVRLTLTATATVGTRTPVIELENAGGSILYSRIGASRIVAASGSLTLQFSEGLDAAVTDHERLPPMEMGRGTRLRVRDLANIDAVDSLTVQIVGVAKG